MVLFWLMHLEDFFSEALQGPYCGCKVFLGSLAFLDGRNIGSLQSP